MPKGVGHDQPSVRLGPFPYSLVGGYFYKGWDILALGTRSETKSQQRILSLS